MINSQKDSRRERKRESSWFRENKMSERKIKDQKRRNCKRNTRSGAKNKNLSRCEKMGLKSEKRFGRGT